MPHLTAEKLARIPIPLPPLEKQRAIADYLDRGTARIDTLIEEQQRLIEVLRERRDGAVTKAFLRATTDSDERKLKYTVDDVTVGIVVQPSRWYVDVGYSGARGVNVKHGLRSPLADLVNISAEGHAAHPKSQLRSGDVVVVRTGQAGAAAKVPDELDGANAIDILIVRPGENADADFLVWYLNSPLAASRIEHGSVGAIQGHFNVSALRASWAGPGPDSHRQATTSLRTTKNTMTIRHGVTSRSAGRTKDRGWRVPVRTSMPQSPGSGNIKFAWPLARGRAGAALPCRGRAWGASRGWRPARWSGGAGGTARGGGEFPGNVRPDHDHAFRVVIAD